MLVMHHVPPNYCLHPRPPDRCRCTHILLYIKALVGEEVQTSKAHTRGKFRECIEQQYCSSLPLIFPPHTQTSQLSIMSSSQTRKRSQRLKLTSETVTESARRQIQEVGAIAQDGLSSGAWIYPLLVSLFFNR